MTSFNIRVSLAMLLSLGTAFIIFQYPEIIGSTIGLTSIIFALLIATIFAGTCIVDAIKLGK